MVFISQRNYAIAETGINNVLTFMHSTMFRNTIYMFFMLIINHLHLPAILK